MLTCKSSSKGGKSGGGGGGANEAAGGVGDAASFRRLLRVVSAADVARRGPVWAAAGEMRPK